MLIVVKMVGFYMFLNNAIEIENEPARFARKPLRRCVDFIVSPETFSSLVLFLPRLAL